MPNQPCTWLGSEAPWLGPEGRLWGHRRLPPGGSPATSLSSNLWKLGQELLLHVFGMNPGLLLLPGKAQGGERRQSSLLPSLTLPPRKAGSPSTSTPVSPGTAGPWLLHCHGLHTGLIDLIDDVSQLTHELREAQAEAETAGRGEVNV